MAFPVPGSVPDLPVSVQSKKTNTGKSACATVGSCHFVPRYFLGTFSAIEPATVTTSYFPTAPIN
jgi:hypothetical protein